MAQKRLERDPMKILSYPAIIFEDEGRYGVVFPDISGCLTDGETVEEANVNAQLALSQHVDAMFEQGMGLPLPSDLSTVVFEGEEKEVKRVLVNVTV